MPGRTTNVATRGWVLITPLYSAADVQKPGESCGRKRLVRGDGLKKKMGARRRRCCGNMKG